jgi:signal transduction histidine kinase
MISDRAIDLDNQIYTINNALKNVASVAPENILEKTEIAQKWLENRTGIRTYFDHSLVILDKKGKLVAGVPKNPYGNYDTVAYRNFFEKSSNIPDKDQLKPFESTINRRAVIVMSSIIRDKNKNIVGYLYGAIDLLKKNSLFETLRNFRIGNGGYLYLFSADRMMIMHPDSTRIMKKDVKPGMNLMFDKALNGFEGSGETINSKGIEFLVSFKSLKSTNWILAANFPTSEAYQPIIQFRNYYLLGMLFVLIIAVFLVSKLSLSIANQLTNFTKGINKLAEPTANRSLRINESRTDELGQLAGSFNSLMDEVQRHEEEQSLLFDQIIESREIIEANLYQKNGLIEELTEKQNEIERINSEKDKFFSIIAHDLKSPLSGFLGLTRIMVDEINNISTEDILLFTSDMKDSASSLYELLENLLEWASIQNGRISFNLEICYLNYIINQNFSLLSEPARQKNISLIALVDENINFFADYSMLNTIFRNLISNAIKFTNNEGKIEIGVNTEMINNNILIYVKDSGVGMSKEIIDKLFKLDSKITSLGTNNEKGTGLGLILCKEFIEKHGGEIWVESELGNGTTFYFSMPNSQQLS